MRKPNDQPQPKSWRPMNLTSFLLENYGSEVEIIIKGNYIKCVPYIKVTHVNMTVKVANNSTDSIDWPIRMERSIEENIRSDAEPALRLVDASDKIGEW